MRACVRACERRVRSGSRAEYSTHRRSRGSTTTSSRVKFTLRASSQYLFGGGREQYMVCGLDDVVLCVRIFPLRLVGEYLCGKGKQHQIHVDVK